MILPPPRSTRTDTLFPSPTPFRSPPVDDELSAPLTPLPVFDVTPAPAGQQQAASDQPPAVSYRLRVEGFEGTGLGDRFRDLSALEVGDGSAETAAMIEARAQADEELAMRSEEHTSEIPSLMRSWYAVFCLTKQKNAT